jgi:DNA-binding FadR family transcriptional regulator
MDAFAPINASRAGVSIADQIRQAILAGRFRAGERLIERELAEQFGVSRITVRDALRALETMGLIEVRLGARGGAFVTVPSGDVMAQTMLNLMTLWSVGGQDIVEARLVVELGTVTMACARATAEDLARLRELTDYARSELAAGRYERELSWRFHTVLAEAAHNGAAEALTHSFTSSLHRIPLRPSAKARAYALTVDEHERIVEAVELRDGEAARTAMAQHLLRGTKVTEPRSVLRELWAQAPGASRRRAK